MKELLEMYSMVRRTRQVLFSYCETLPPAVYTAERPGYSMGSIRNIHIHAADCYRHWLSAFGLGEASVPLEETDYPDVAAAREAFRASDALVERFLARFGQDMSEPVTRPVRWQKEPLTVSALWLFTHTVTHEFHHKGQIVLMGREAGYPAPDTDLVLP